MTREAKAEIRKMTQKEKIQLFNKLQEDILTVRNQIHNFKKHAIRKQEDAIRYFRTIAPIDREAVFVLFLDAKNKIMDFEKISEGTTTQSLLYPKEIIKSLSGVKHGQ